MSPLEVASEIVPAIVARRKRRTFEVISLPRSLRKSALANQARPLAFRVSGQHRANCARVQPIPTVELTGRLREPFVL